MAWAPVALAAVSGGMKAFGAYQEGRAQAEAATYNARVLEAQARLQRQQGDARTEDVYRAYLQRRGQQQAAVASSGIDVSEGTPIRLFEMSAANAEADALNTRYQAELQAFASENEARAQMFKARVAKRAGNLRAVTELLAGGGETFGAGKRAGYWG